MESEAYRLLTDLNESALKEEEPVNALFGRIASYLATMAGDLQSVEEEQTACRWLILLLHDAYDIPFKDENGDMDLDRSEAVFNYMLCAVCPVKATKANLCHFPAENDFHMRNGDWVAAMPELGFLFPAFENRNANIYNAVFYTRNSANTHDGFVEQVFGTPLFVAAPVQKETFQLVLEESLKEECSLEVVQAVHETISEKLAEAKADKQAEPLTITKQDVKEILENSGVSMERTAAFEEEYDKAYGAYSELPAVNLVTPNKFTVETPSVSIKVDPAHSDLLETRIIDGKTYILVLADGNVAVNGVNVIV